VRNGYHNADLGSPEGLALARKRSRSPPFLQEPVERSFQSRWVRPTDRVDYFLALEENERRHGANPELSSDIFGNIDIASRKRDFVVFLVLAVRLVLGSNLMTRATPCSVEIDDRELIVLIRDNGVEVLDAGDVGDGRHRGRCN